MHYGRREEAFRYEFPESLSGEFQITKVNGINFESSIGTMKILDLSWNGLKIRTAYDFHTECNDIEVVVHFQISTVEFSIVGKPIYQESFGLDYIYGIQLSTNDTTREQITEELKELAWRLVKS